MDLILWGGREDFDQTVRDHFAFAAFQLPDGKQREERRMLSSWGLIFQPRSGRKEVMQLRVAIDVNAFLSFPRPPSSLPGRNRLF